MIAPASLKLPEFIGGLNGDREPLRGMIAPASLKQRTGQIAWRRPPNHSGA